MPCHMLGKQHRMADSLDSHEYDMCNARGSMSTSIMLLLGQVPLQLPPKTAKRAD